MLGVVTYNANIGVIEAVGGFSFDLDRDFEFGAWRTLKLHGSRIQHGVEGFDRSIQVEINRTIEPLGLALRRFSPPRPLIECAWGILELLLSIAGYRLLRAPQASARTAALCAWLLTLLGVAGYPWLIFRRKRLASSATESSALLTGTGGMVIAAREVDEPAAVMTVPLLFWLGFATLLSEELWRRHPNRSRD